MKKTFIYVIIIVISALYPSPPPDVPGEELDNKTYFDYITRNTLWKGESALREEESFERTNADKLSLSWGTSSIHDQISEDTTSIKYGMGVVFVPKMSSSSDIEPSFYIYNSKNELVKSGETGNKINLMPGKYMLKISENASFDAAEEFYINENEITSIIPPWSCVRIEVIDENGKPIRGEYDLAMLNPLTAMGRGRGRDIDLAEDLRVWFLPVGNYKLLRVGSALNSISNFLTFKVTSGGEFIRFTIVQEPNTNRILGGGMLIEDIAAEKRSKKFTHIVNIGGSVDFDCYRDNIVDTAANLTSFSLLLYDRFNYSRNKLETMILARIDAGFLIEDMKRSTIKSVSDELRINTLFTYRIFKRLGPYWRGEFISSMFSKTADFSYEQKKWNFKELGDHDHMFLLYENIPDIVDDSAEVQIDKTSFSMRISPAFSPIMIKAGGGFNVQILKNHIVNMNFLSGFGADYEKKWDSWQIVSEKNMKFDTNSDIYKNIYNSNIDRINLEKNDGERFDYGPEFMINYFAYITKFVSLYGDVRLFMPIERFDTPDLRLNNLLSFHLTQYLSVDYDYKFDLVQANQENLRAKSNKHRILIRFSFARK
ncbi:MAG: hypothetical protein LBH98_04855 [Chitinispirillales bacterium]|jgi:hypothetical protein|nr:hypothetical protein [Chitinispirillales bacterium]